MKAIRIREFGGPEKLVLEEIPDLKPGAGEVLVDVHAAGVNPVDVYIATGTYPLKPNLPYTPGLDGAGIVRSVGEGVANVKAGDRVYFGFSISGSYAQQALAKATNVHRLAAAATFAQGAAMGVPYATAYRALFQRAHAMPGETVLVHGASGGVGLAALQLAHSHGLNVIGTASTENGRKLVLANGAHHALDHSAADMAEQLAKITGGNGGNVILEMLANKNLAKDLTMLSKRGRVVTIGSRGPIEINPRDIMGRDGAILGMSLFNANEQELATIHAALVAGLETGVLKPVIDEEIPLADARRAHESIMAPGTSGKIVIKVA